MFLSQPVFHNALSEIPNSSAVLSPLFFPGIETWILIIGSACGRVVDDSLANLSSDFNHDWVSLKIFFFNVSLVAEASQTFAANKYLSICWEFERTWVLQCLQQIQSLFFLTECNCLFCFYLRFESFFHFFAPLYLQLICTSLACFRQL